MKMKLYIAVAITAAMLLTACGSTQSESIATTSEPASSAVETESAPAEEPASTDESQGKTSFANNVCTSDDYTITITEYKIIQPGETGNEYGESPVIAFWYDTTNTGDSEDLTPTTAWMLTFEAVQDNDPNVVNTLNVGMLPDDQFMDSQIQNIKLGGTVSNAVAYELDDTTTPVTLTAKDILGNVYGSQEFPVTE